MLTTVSTDKTAGSSKRLQHVACTMGAAVAKVVVTTLGKSWLGSQQEYTSVLRTLVVVKSISKATCKLLGRGEWTPTDAMVLGESTIAQVETLDVIVG
uniref:Uncharacterized protein n=1 Tax=Romanomermis culicivorax TaxID=13658 RepID=A0A915KSR3_ROMCU